MAVGFLAGHVLDGRPLEESVIRGVILARHTCTLRGETDNLMTTEGLDVAFAGIAAKGRL